MGEGYPLAAQIRGRYTERLLYASDHPWLDPRLIRDNIHRLKLAPGQEALVFSGNARRLFGL
jgi:hypothetical protein